MLHFGCKLWVCVWYGIRWYVGIGMDRHLHISALSTTHLSINAARYIQGFNRALIILTMLSIIIDMNGKHSKEYMQPLSSLVLSFYSVPANYEQKSPQEVYIDQMSALLFVLVNQSSVSEGGWHHSGSIYMCRELWGNWRPFGGQMLVSRLDSPRVAVPSRRHPEAVHNRDYNDHQIDRRGIQGGTANEA